MKKYIKDYAVLFSIAGFIVLLDQLTKAWVRSNLRTGTVLFPDLWLSQYARILHIGNKGAAFGMFQHMDAVSIFITLLSFVVVGVILYYYPNIPRQEWTTRLALSLLLGGAVGNLIDRLTQGYVTDFISIWTFPVFNVADASISTGVVVLALGLWLQERHAAKTAPDAPEDAQDEDPESPSANISVTEEAPGE